MMAAPASPRRPRSPSSASAGREHADAGHGIPKLLKVDQAKIDLLMNLIGELVVSKNSLPFLAKRAEEFHSAASYPAR